MVRVALMWCFRMMARLCTEQAHKSMGWGCKDLFANPLAPWTNFGYCTGRGTGVLFAAPSGVARLTPSRGGVPSLQMFI